MNYYNTYKGKLTTQYPCESSMLANATLNYIKKNLAIMFLVFRRFSLSALACMEFDRPGLGSSDSIRAD